MKFLSAGDTFSGNVHFESCSEVDDHPAVIVVTESAGNALRAKVVSYVGKQVREYSAYGFFHVLSRKLILTPKRQHSTGLGIICSFSETDDQASCVLRRNFLSQYCGTFDVKRDFTGVYAMSSAIVIDLF